MSVSGTKRPPNWPKRPWSLGTRLEAASAATGPFAAKGLPGTEPETVAMVFIPADSTRRSTLGKILDRIPRMVKPPELGLHRARWQERSTFGDGRKELAFNA